MVRPPGDGQAPRRLVQKKKFPGLEPVRQRAVGSALDRRATVGRLRSNGMDAPILLIGIDVTISGRVAAAIVAVRLLQSERTWLTFIATGETCTHLEGNDRMPEPIPFVSTCPVCRQRQPQRGFSRAAILRLLNGGYPIEAYCVPCDEFWSISLAERVAITMQLGPLWGQSGHRYH